MHFFDKLAEIEKKYDELSVQLSAPGVVADPARYQKAAKAHADLREMVEKFRQWKEVQKGLVETKTLLEESASDPAMKTLAHEEIAGLERQQGEIEAELKVLLVPKDPNDEKNVVLEIRAGTGGDEAALFAADLFRMYTKFAERNGWRLEVMSSNDTGVGGLKEVIAMIEGRGVYSKLKYESGVHRVQRVPATEASGRIHTSTVTVAVLA